MGIYLRPEWRTEIEGDGEGFIRISQEQDGETQVVWVSVAQFHTIVSDAKMLIKEAIGGE
jgi:hypothetical protein